MSKKTDSQSSFDRVRRGHSQDAPYDSFSAAFEELYPDFPRESQEAGTHHLNLMRVHQTGHEKLMPPNPDIVFRLVAGGSLKTSSVDLGEGKVELSGRKGSFYIAPANAAAEWRSEGEHELLMMSVSQDNVLDLLSFEETTPSKDPLRALYGRDIFNSALPNFLEAIWRESAREGGSAGLMVDGLFMTLLGTLARLAGEEETSNAGGESASLDNKRLVRVTDYIDANLERTIVIRELADIAGLSPFHFSRCFRATTNTSPHRFVTARRIEASKRMLADPEIPLAQIAFACGFSSQSHFTKAFKDQVGATPGCFRSQVTS